MTQFSTKLYVFSKYYTLTIHFSHEIISGRSMIDRLLHLFQFALLLFLSHTFPLSTCKSSHANAEKAIPGLKMGIVVVHMGKHSPCEVMRLLSLLSLVVVAAGPRHRHLRGVLKLTVHIPLENFDHMFRQPPTPAGEPSLLPLTRSLLPHATSHLKLSPTAPLTSSSYPDDTPCHPTIPSYPDSLRSRFSSFAQTLSIFPDFHHLSILSLFSQTSSLFIDFLLPKLSPSA